MDYDKKGEGSKQNSENQLNVVQCPGDYLDAIVLLCETIRERDTF